MFRTEVLLDEAIFFFLPLVQATEDENALLYFFQQSGYDLPSADLGAIFRTVSAATQVLRSTFESLIDSDLADADELFTLVDSFRGVFDEVRAFSNIDSLQPIVGDVEAWMLEVFDSLANHYLSTRVPLLAAALQALGVIVREEVKTTDPDGRAFDYLRTRILWNRLIDFIIDTKRWARDVYGWGVDSTADHPEGFDYEAAIESIAHMVEASGLALTRHRPMAAREVAAFLSNSSGVMVTEVAVPILQDSFERVDSDGAPVFSTEAGLKIVPFGDLNQPRNLGLALTPYAQGGIASDQHITDDLKLTMNVEASGAGGMVIVIQPSGLDVRGTASADLTIEFKLSYGRPGQSNIILLGRENATRLQSQVLLAGLRAIPSQFDLEAGASESRIIITRDDGDGFLNKVLPEPALEIPFDLGVGWSNTKGLYFRGGATLEVSLPIHQDLFGVLKIDTVDLALTAAGGTGQSPELRLMAAVTASLKLGPLAASVEKLGLKGIIAFPKDGGNLGPADFSLGFKPPDGAGMVLDAKVVTGGGYIEFNPDEEQYAGILQLEIEDLISIKAIALLTTRVPGLPPGVKGFSLLVILTAEFPPIQLGYGLALLGLGGLFGANRTMLLDPLRDGIKNHTVDSILFPKDPVENAQRIISDLRSIFPPADGRFVLGPMVKLSWGTPPIITGELGILLELPAPIRLAILGKLTLALPPIKDAEVLIIQMDVIGAIDFDKSDASIDATLVDSRVAIFPLTGDMAMRLNWGPSPVFALSAGGFHPRFQPPPKFPTLSRLAISLATGDNPRLRLEAYMAVTASTAMLGARLDAYVEQDLGELIGKLTVQAYLSFDALVQFSPFSLIAEMKGGATLKRNGQNLLALTLAITLTGPQPWHAWGEARFEFLGKHRIGFDVTIGGPAGAPAKISISPLDELVKALSDPHAWSAQLPDERHMLATIRRIEPGQDEVLVHPLGSLTLRQRVVPLGLDLEKYGEANIAGARRYDFDIVLAGAGAAAADLTKQPVKDSFSAAQFFEMSDNEKLGRPAFESFPSGYRWTTVAGVSAGDAVTRSFGYETVVIDAKDSFDSHKEDQPYMLHGAVLQAAYGLGAAALSSMRSTGGARFAGPATQKVVVSEPAFAVADKVNLQTQSGARTATTYTEAELTRRKQRDRAGYQVVASHEVRNA